MAAAGVIFQVNIMKDDNTSDVHVFSVFCLQEVSVHMSVQDKIDSTVMPS